MRQEVGRRPMTTTEDWAGFLIGWMKDLAVGPVGGYGGDESETSLSGNALAQLISYVGAVCIWGDGDLQCHAHE